MAEYDYKKEKKLRVLFEGNKKQELKGLSQIGVRNAFHGLRFGLHNKRGVHGACPLEMLHAILLGIFMYTRDCFFDQMGKTSVTARNMNGLSRKVGLLLARQSDRDKPRTKFSRGIHKGKLMAKEYTGVLLIMSALLQSEDGRSLLRTARLKDMREKGKISDWASLVETLLQWEAYLTLGEMKKDHVNKLVFKHRFLLYLLKNTAARTEGMGWKVMKYHAVLHLAKDILMFGVPMNVDTGSNESHHKITKVAAKLTQKNLETFEEQTSNRLDDLHVLNLSLEELEGRSLADYERGYEREEVFLEEEPEEQGSSTGGMKFRVILNQESNELVAEVLTRQKKQKPWRMDQDFLAFVHSLETAIAPPNQHLIVFAEHTRKGQIFRAHPNFRNKGVSWQDWVMINWGPAYGDLPAQVWGYLQLSMFDDGKEVGLPGHLSDGFFVYNGTWAIVENSSYMTKEQKEEAEKERRDKDKKKKKGKRRNQETDEVNDNGESVIWKELVLERMKEEDGTVRRRRKFYLVDVEAFKQPLVVIVNMGTTDRYLMMKPRSEWSEDFVRFIESDRKLDEKEMQEEEVEEEEAVEEDVEEEDGGEGDEEEEDDEEDEVDDEEDEFDDEEVEEDDDD